MAHDSIGLPPDGAGKRLHTHSVDHEGDITHNQIMTIGDPNFSDRLQYVDEYGAAYVRSSEGNQIFDGFGKSKMSTETLIGEYVSTYGITSETSGKVSGTASYAFLPNESALKLMVGTDDGDHIQMTTHRYHKFFSGISQLIQITGSVGDSGKANVVRRWGYYDDDNGIIFDMDGTDFGIIIRSSVSGSVVETRVSQLDFNVDKADGTGTSRQLIDPAKVNTYWIDIQANGRIRIGVYSEEGQRVILHEIKNTNSDTHPAMGTYSLPLRVEQFNTGLTASGSEMKALSAVVYTESADLDFRGRCFSTAPFSSVPITPKVTTADDAFHTSVSIRPKATFNGKVNRKAIVPSNLMVNTDKALQLSIMYNITLDGTETWYDVHPESSVEKCPGGVIVDLGSQDSHFCQLIGVGTNVVDLEKSFHYLRKYLRLNADGSQPTYSIIFRSLDGSIANVVAGMTWTELNI